MVRPLSEVSEEYLTWLAVERGRAQNTLASYRRDLSAFEEFLEGRTIQVGEVTQRHIEDFLAFRRATKPAASSLARLVSTLRGLYAFALEEGYTTYNPMSQVASVRGGDRIPKAIDEADVARLIDSITGSDPLALRDRAILELLYGSGLRIGELVGADISDLRLESGVMRVVGKGDKERIVPVTGMSVAALQRWFARGRPELIPRRWARKGDSEALFLNSRGGRLSRQGAWAMLRSRSEPLGLDSTMHPHVLRHSCATHMLAHGADIRVVQELLGHSSIATTQIYTRVSVDHLRRVIDEIHPRSLSSRHR